MAEKDLKKKLTELISSFQEEGILDDYFDEVKGLQDKEKCPQFLTNIITTYLNGAAKTIEELTTNLGKPAVNYTRVRYLADKLRGSSLSIGGTRVANVCGELYEASEAEKKEASEAEKKELKEACTALFKGLEIEFLTLEDSLNKIAQLEEEIYYKNKKDQTEQ